MPPSAAWPGGPPAKPGPESRTSIRARRPCVQDAQADAVIGPAGAAVADRVRDELARHQQDVGEPGAREVGLEARPDGAPREAHRLRAAAQRELARLEASDGEQRRVVALRPGLEATQRPVDRADELRGRRAVDARQQREQARRHRNDRPRRARR